MMTIDKSFLRLSRLEGLTDGVFAIAMTILVFGLQLPDNVQVSDLPQLLEKHILEKLFVYVGSFIILGTQWIAFTFQHGFLLHVNRPYLWMNIFTLMVICIIPFSASLLVDYPKSFISISFYALNLIVISIGQFSIWYFAQKFSLNNEAYTYQAKQMVKIRILFPLIFYVFALIVAHWNTYIAFIALIVPPFIHMLRSKADTLPIRIKKDTIRKTPWKGRGHD